MCLMKVIMSMKGFNLNCLIFHRGLTTSPLSTKKTFVNQRMAIKTRLDSNYTLITLNVETSEKQNLFLELDASA